MRHKVIRKIFLFIFLLSFVSFLVPASLYSSSVLSELNDPSFAQKIGDSLILSEPFLDTKHSFRSPSNAHNDVWNKTYGGFGLNDIGYAIIECSTGGFAFIGVTDTFGAGLLDIWFIRIDNSGTIMWGHTFGGTQDDSGFNLVECSDGGFALVGYTANYGLGGRDVWVIRTDAEGTYLWNQTYGGLNADVGQAIIECSSGGFLIAGTTKSTSTGDADIWLIRIDAQGEHLWNSTFGGMNDEFANAAVECSSGNFVVIGYTTSFGAGEEDVWMVRTDAAGNHLWNQTYGGVETEVGTSLVECENGDLAFTGHTTSFGAGEEDVWAVRTNANGTLLWSHTFGETMEDVGNSIVECQRGGFAITGYTRSFGSTVWKMWLLRIDAYGSYLWDHRYIGSSGVVSPVLAIGNSLIESSDSGYVIIGYTHLQLSCADRNVWVVRVPDPPIFWHENLVDQIIEVNSSFQYQLQAFTYTDLDQWRINYTSIFTIDSTGYITNDSFLPVGIYTIQVQVNDTASNNLFGIFRVIVEDPNTQTTYTGLPIDSLVAVVLVVGIVILFGLILIFRRQTIS